MYLCAAAVRVGVSASGAEVNCGAGKARGMNERTLYMNCEQRSEAYHLYICMYGCGRILYIYVCVCGGIAQRRRPENTVQYGLAGCCW